MAKESCSPRAEDQRLVDPSDCGELFADDVNGTERRREDRHEGLVVRARDVSRDQARAPHPAVFEQARTDQPVDLTQGIRRADPREPGKVGDGHLAGRIEQECCEDARLRVGAKDGQEGRSWRVHMTYYIIWQSY